MASTVIKIKVLRYIQGLSFDTNNFALEVMVTFGLRSTSLALLTSSLF